MSDNALLVSVSEWDHLRAQLQQALTERDAARKWAATWKQAAKENGFFRKLESRAVHATQQCLATEYERMTNIAKQRDNALRVVAAARSWKNQPAGVHYSDWNTSPAAILARAVREWEQAQAKEKRG